MGQNTEQRPKNRLYQVLFFEENSDKTFDLTGESPIYSDSYVAMNTYAETPNPASQLIEASSMTELEVSRMQMIKNMSDKKYLDEFVFPYL